MSLAEIGDIEWVSGRPAMLGQGNIQFGPFELDLESGELRKHGRTVRLSPKPWKALALMATAPGRLITRESIRKELWDSDIHVDFEHALNFCIREVRTALGDNAKEPRYIETLPRRGYRFIAPTSGSAAEVQPAESALAPCDSSRQLEAYQYYESARKSLGQSGKEALEKARQGFKRPRNPARICVSAFRTRRHFGALQSEPATSGRP